MRKIGKLDVSDIGLGCMGMSHAYGEALTMKQISELIREAIDTGYNFFDTAEVYGTPDCPHHNEEALGKALKNCRKDVVISTKFGVRFDYDSGKVPFPILTDSDIKQIRKSLEGTLRRLKTDYIDLYYQHRVDPTVAPEEVAILMSELKKEGKILEWGVSEASEDYIRRANAVCPIAAIQNRYSMIARWHENIFPLLEELNISFVAFSPLANGFLSNQYDESTKFDNHSDYRSKMPQFSSSGYKHNCTVLELLKTLALDKHATPAQISLSWMLNKKPYIIPIPGTTKSGRLRENFGAARIELAQDEVKAIDSALDLMKNTIVFGGTNCSKDVSQKIG